MLDALFTLNTLWWLILMLYIPACLGLIVVVLLQKGKGVGFAGAFGVGAGSDTVFGPRSAKSLPQRLTYVMAGIFMVLALVMSTLSGKVGKGSAPALETEALELSNGRLDALFDETDADAEGDPAISNGDTGDDTVDSNEGIESETVAPDIADDAGATTDAGQ